MQNTKNLYSFRFWKSLGFSIFAFESFVNSGFDTYSTAQYIYIYIYKPCNNGTPGCSFSRSLTVYLPTYPWWSFSCTTMRMPMQHQTGNTKFKLSMATHQQIVGQSSLGTWVEGGCLKHLAACLWNKRPFLWKTSFQQNGHFEAWHCKSSIENSWIIDANS